MLQMGNSTTLVLAIVALGASACEGASAVGNGGQVPQNDTSTALADAEQVSQPDTAVGSAAGFNLAELALSGSRLKVRGYKSADGAVLPMLGFWDSKLNAWCNAQTTADGKVRCVPLAAGSNGGFVDPDCTQPAHLKSPFSFSTGDVKYAMQAESSNVCGGASTGYFKLGEQVPATSVYVKSGDKCELLPSGTYESMPCYAFHRRGEQVPVTDFAEIEVVELK